MTNLKDKSFWILIFSYCLYLVSISLVIWIFHLVFDLPPSNVSLKDTLWGIWGYGWDGWHYLSIATTGYSFPNQAFFPLYPLLVKFFDLFLPLSLSYRVNLLLLPVLFWLLLRLATAMGIQESKKTIAVLVFLLFPTAFILQANYTETLFIVISAATLLLLLNKRFWLAAIFCGLATATRVNGLALAVVVLLAFAVHNKHALTKISTTAKTSLIGLICGLGLIFYFVYLHYTFGSFQVFFEAEREWFKSPASIVSTPLTITGSLIYALPNTVNVITNPPPSLFDRKQAVRGLFEPLFVAFGLFLLIFSWRKIRWELYLFSLLNFLLPLASGSTVSLGRYLLLMYPAILYFGARLQGSSFLPLYIFVATLLQGLFIILFVNNVFIV